MGGAQTFRAVGLLSGRQYEVRVQALESEEDALLIDAYRDPRGRLLGLSATNAEWPTCEMDTLLRARAVVADDGMIALDVELHPSIRRVRFVGSDGLERVLSADGIWFRPNANCAYVAE